MNGEAKNSLVVGKFAVLTALLIILAVVTWNRAIAAGSGIALPDAAVDAPLAAKSGKQTAVVAGGLFLGNSAGFPHVKRGEAATFGESGGAVSSPGLEDVSTGTT